jgi:hypothetical protein
MPIVAALFAATYSRGASLSTSAKFEEGSMSITFDLSPGSMGRVASFLPATDNPREEMARRLPACLQPFISWLTARPIPGAAARERTAIYHIVTAFLAVVAGVGASGLAFFAADGAAQLALLPLASILTASGMGKLQAVIYHHCAHCTVLRRRAHNICLGRAIGILLLVKHFDSYQSEHMIHHSPKKLLTHEDEFAQFVFNLCGLRLGLPKNVLWRSILLSFASPFFHMRFLLSRISANLLSRSPAHNLVAMLYWALLLVAVDAADAWTAFIVLWLVPLVVLFQIATALRVLCEHRFPHESIMALRDKRFVGHATAGVFAGHMPPIEAANSAAGALKWMGWWVRMLTLHLFERVFVLVGDAPAHDFHHRHPASRKWANYIQAREADRLAGCPNYPVNYGESWGLFRAIDENLALMSLAKGRRLD